MQSFKYIIILTVLLSVSEVFSQLPTHKQWENIYGTGENDNPHKFYDLGNGDFAASGFVNGGQTREDYGHWFVFDNETGEEKISGFSPPIVEHISASTTGGFFFGVNNRCQYNTENFYDDIAINVTDSNGNLASKCYGTNGDDRLIDVFDADSGSKILIGYQDESETEGYGDLDVWIAKISPQNEVVWEKRIGGSNLDAAYLSSKTSKNKIVVAVYTFSNDSDFSNLSTEEQVKIVFFEFDFSGEVKVLGSFPYKDLNGIVSYRKGAVSGDYFYIAGSQAGKGVIYKFNYVSGELIYHKEFGAYPGVTSLKNIFRSTSNELIVGGITTSTGGEFSDKDSTSDNWIFYLDSLGEIIHKIYPSGRGATGNMKDFLVTKEGEILVLSSNDSKENFPEHYGPFDHEIPSDFYIYKLGYSPVSSISDSEGFPSFSAFPNPNNTGLLNTNLKANYSLLDMQGRILKSYIQSDVLDISDINSGTYLLQHESGAVVKIVVGY